VRTARTPTTTPVAPQNTTLPASPPNTFPPHNLPDSAIATQLKLPNQSHCEEFNFPEGVDDFKSSLLDYGRSIIDSAINEDADLQTLESDIITAKEKLIAQFTAVYQHFEELSDSFYSRDGEAAELRTEISELKRAKAAMEEEKSDVIQAMDVDYAMKKKEADNHCEEKERYQKMWEEAEKGRKEAEAELAGIKQDNKRKRDRMEKMWGNVEREVKQ
jgi:chromosome segregation ATPase